MSRILRTLETQLYRLWQSTAHFVVCWRMWRVKKVLIQLKMFLGHLCISFSYHLHFLPLLSSSFVCVLVLFPPTKANKDESRLCNIFSYSLDCWYIMQHYYYRHHLMKARKSPISTLLSVGTMMVLYLEPRSGNLKILYIFQSFFVAMEPCADREVKEARKSCIANKYCVFWTFHSSYISSHFLYRH